MARTGIKDLDRVVEPYDIVELESNWTDHVIELADIIWRLARNGPVYVIVLNSSKYVDIDELLEDLEPFLEDIGNIKIHMINSLEAMAYHLLFLDKVRNNSVVLILPYRRDLVSQTENTHLPKLRSSLKTIAARGWNIVVINPVSTPMNLLAVNMYYLGDITLRIIFGEKENYVEVLNRSVVARKTILR